MVRREKNPIRGESPPPPRRDRTGHLSDAEDSVVLRKKSLRRQRQDMVYRRDLDVDDQSNDEIGGHWEDYPMGSIDYGSVNPGRWSTCGGPQGGRGAASHGMNDLMDDMDLRPRGTGGRKPDFRERIWDDMESDILEDVTGSVDKSDPNVWHLAALQRRRALILEVMASEEEDHQDKEPSGRIDRRLSVVEEEIAKIASALRQRSEMPRRMKDSMDMLDKSPRRSRAGGRLHIDSTLGIRDLPKLRESRAYMLESLTHCGRGEDRKMLEANLNLITEDIARLNYEEGKCDRIRRGREGSTLRGKLDDSEGDSDLQPSRHRPGHQHPPTAHGRHFGR